ncbi:hypothetical protein V9T40_007376 [Parthenolecanium corni]|uniref:Deltamethrin resistance protein prag01 domain-containing protein n=1 Tax=Parthenolecanium corni TaxID=536013 RepID=A0AAN9TW96_9HEMI
MSLQVYRSLCSRSRVLQTGIRSIVVRLAHHDTSIKPINEPPNEHLPFRPAILDDLPVPEGDWLEDYKKRNRRYWMHFFMGLTALSSTIYFMYEYEPIFFNARIPDMPPKEERIKSFWQPSDDDDDDDDDE